MAVNVYDRSGKEWIYEQGSYVLFDEFALVIWDDEGKPVGAFQPSAWTHYYIAAPVKFPPLLGATTISVNSVDDAMAAKDPIAAKKALKYTQR